MNLKRPVYADAEFLVLVLSLLWPWEIYRYLLFAPEVNANVESLVALGLIALWGYAVAVRRRLRLPFELAWPTAALLVLVWALAWRRDFDTPFLATGTILLFVAAAHFGCSRGLAERALWVSCLSGGAVAAVTLFALATGRLPIAPWLELGLPAPRADDLPAAGLTLTICFFVALYHATAPERSLKRRIAAGGCAALVLAAFTGAAGSGLGRWIPYAYPRHARFGLLEMLALGCVVWVVARVAAKVEVQRRETSRRIHWLFLGIGLAAGLWCAWFPMKVGLSYGFLAGLICAAVLPGGRDLAPPPRLPLPEIAAVCLAAPLILLNEWHIFPENRNHPWNYEVAAQRDFGEGRFETLQKRMDAFENRSPCETRTHLWRARAALAQGLPHRAAHEFALSLRENPVRKTLLAGPTAEEWNDFMTRLRDYCSTAPQPERSFAFDCALAARGSTHSVLAVLEQESAHPSAGAQEADSAPLAATAAFLLGSDALSAQLATWSSPKLLALLENWGATVTEAPESFPHGALPLVLAAQLLPDSVRVFAAAGSERPTVAEWERVTRDYGVTDWDGGGWALPAPVDTESWSAELRLGAAGGHTLIAKLMIRPGGALELSRHTIPTAATPDSPTVLILLPERR